MPFVRESQVMTLTEDADALAEHLAGIRLSSLPLGRLLPDALTVAASQVEARVHRRRFAVAGGLCEAHVVEGVADFVRHRVADGFTRGGVDPQGATGWWTAPG